MRSQSKIRSKSRTASEELVRSLTKVFQDKKVPIALLTGLSKKYAKKTLDPNSQFVRRLTDNKDAKSLNATKLSEYLAENTNFQRGQQLSDEAIKRAHTAFCNTDGRMTF
jgi:folylpolyglutamate synthase/dihydropteroate synthase